jgi:uncharacterized protein
MMCVPFLFEQFCMIYGALSYANTPYWTTMQKIVKVKPHAKQQKIAEQVDGSLIVWLKSPPVDGKANAELIKLLADKFNVSKSQIRIKSGVSSRQKLIEIDTDI